MACPIARAQAGGACRTCHLYGKGISCLDMESVLDATRDDLDRLSDAEAVELFASLLWADSFARGIRAEIEVPRNTDARDGGIDATVRAPVDTARTGVIGPGVTRYQIKSGRGFNPAAKDARRRLLFRPGGSGLRPRIKHCLDAGEAFVVVLFGTDAPGHEQDTARLIREDLAGVDPSYRDARVEVWYQSLLLEHLKRHPALQRRVKGTSNIPFLSHTQWASTEDMARRFVSGPPQEKLIARARDALRSAGGADVRITGRPGSGKTRIAHEITRPGDLEALVLYFENPTHARLGNFLGDLIANDGARAILVVDECDTENHAHFRNRLAGAGGRVGLVTIHNKKDDPECYELDDLGLAEIREIIKGYGADAPDDAVDELARRCEPSPRYAHHMAKILASDSGGLPDLSLGKDAVHEHYIGAGLGPHDSDRARRRKTVLLRFSLFARVGYEGSRSGEYEFIRKVCEQEAGITPDEFNTIIHELRGLKILQGYKALYIAPHMLHLWLWNEWWSIHGHSPAPGTFLSPGDGGMPDALKMAFREMIDNNNSDPKIAAAAAALLGDGGPFDEGGGDALEDTESARTFAALAGADPDSALRLLERTVCKWDDRRLGGFVAGRRQVVGAIERMAEKSEDLEAAARVLSCLAASENEFGIANSATGILARLFVMAPAALAGTPASVEDRLALLAKMLGHRDKRRRALALKACDSALESIHASRLDYERDRIHWSPRGWVPAGEEAAAYRRVISMLCGMLDSADPGEGRTAAAIIIGRAPELTRLQAVSGSVVDALRRVLEKGAADRLEVAKTAELVLRANEERMDGEAAAACRRLAAELAGGDYGSRMRRYVGNVIPSGASSLPDGPGAAKIETAVRDLAAESLRDRDALLGQSDWLFGPGVGRAQMFGRELAAQDSGHALLPDLIDAMSKPGGDLSGLLIGGYLGEVSRGDPVLWESTVDAMERSGRLAPLVPAVVWWSRITDGSWGRLVRMYRSGAAKKDAIAMFAHGGRACELSYEAFCEAVGIMLEAPSAGDTRAALALLSGRCVCRDPEREVPAEAACRVLLDDVFMAGPREGSRASIVDIHWATVAERLARDEPSLVPRMAGAAFRSMGSDGGVFSGPRGRAFGALDAMAERMPEQVWECAADCLAAPPDQRSYRILEWASGRMPGEQTWPGAPSRPGAAARAAPLLERVRPESVWAWVERDRVPRASCIAEFLPRTISGQGCIARRLLVRYGAHKRVRDALHRNFRDAAWMGSGIDYFARARKECREIASSEPDPNVRAWLDERIEIIDGALAKEMAVEARMR